MGGNGRQKAKVGVLSDTHGFLDPQIFQVFDDCDEIWHAGDWGTYDIYADLSAWKPGKVRGVFGNVDGWDLRRELPEDNFFVFCGMKILITHIGGEPGRYSGRILPFIKGGRIDMLVCGHTHILKVVKDRTYNLWYINPGAAGTVGPHRVRTALKLHFSQERGFYHAEAVEFGPR